MFLKRPKTTPPPPPPQPVLITDDPPKAKASPKRRDKFTREERRRLPGYSCPDSAPFYKAMSDVYDEQTLKNKLSEYRYEYPPTEVPDNYYKLDL